MPVSDDDLLHIADRKTVYHDDVARSFFFEGDHFCTTVLYFYYHSVIWNDNIFRAYHPLGDIAMNAKHIMITVNRDEKLRFYFFMYPCELFGISMTGRMNVGCFVMDDMCALP